MWNNPTTFPYQPAPLPDAAGKRPSRRWIDRHPYTGALLLLVYWLVLLLGLGRLFRLVLVLAHIQISALLANLIGEVLLVLIVVLPLALLRWWSEVGFTRGIGGRGLLICLMPLILVCGPVLIGLPMVIGEAPESIVVTAVVLSLLVGFAEEGMFRGLILRSLLPAGIWSAVLLSALCFACVHLTNLIQGASWGYVAQQMILAFGTGVLFAAVRLRTGSLWPTILLHAGRDVAGLILLGINPSLMNVPLSNIAIIYNAIFCLLFLLNALVLLRASQVRKLKVAYGLASPLPSPPLPPYGPLPTSHSSDNTPPFYPGSVSYREYPAPPISGDQPPVPPYSQE